MHVSTDEVYGPASPASTTRKGAAHRPSNPYSASKACQEAIVHAYWRTYGLPCAVTNTMNMIGERQDPEKFVPLALAKIVAGEEVPIHVRTDGTNGLALLPARPHLRERARLPPGAGAVPAVRRRERDGALQRRRRGADNAEMARLIADLAGFRLIEEAGRLPHVPARARPALRARRLEDGGARLGAAARPRRLAGAHDRVDDASTRSGSCIQVHACAARPSEHLCCPSSRR